MISRAITPIFSGISLFTLQVIKANEIILLIKTKQGSKFMNYSTKIGSIKHQRVGGYGYFLLIIPFGTFLLGTWQVKRKKWKQDLIEELSHKTTLPFINFPKNIEDLEDLEYRKIQLVGTFDHTREIYLGPRSLLVDGDRKGSNIMSSGQPGYNVITPFKLSDRDLTILVNRGWVLKKSKNPETRQDGQVSGEVLITGILRKQEKRPPFMLESKNSDLFFYRDLEKMAQITGSFPIYLEAIETFPGGPKGSQTRITLRDEHLSYIITWYSLSLATSFLWYRKYIMGKVIS